MLNLEAAGNSVNHQQSVASTVSDEIDYGRPMNAPHGEPEIPLTRANSVAGEQVQLTIPPRDPLSAVLEHNRQIHLDLNDTIPNTYNPEDFIQSATEVATPSISNTPNLAAADKAIQDGKKFVDALARLNADVDEAEGCPASASQEQLQCIIKSTPVHILESFVPYLPSLHNLLNSMPDVANTIHDLTDRVSNLENGSFNFVNPDENQRQYEGIDSRIIALEHWTEDHETLHRAIDNDYSSHSLTRRRTVADSFSSTHSLQSTTSSTLILANMNRREMATEIGDLKDRLDMLEAAALPTTFNQWEVEVVLLPWGRDLRGIWSHPNDPMHDHGKGTAQDSEDWTQARGSIRGQPRPSSVSRHHAVQSESGHSSRSSHPFSDSEGVWSSEAISDWASGSSNELLFPLACGIKGVIYHRLKSRGFVKTVHLKSSSAKDIQTTLSHAFNELIEHLRYTNEDEDPAIIAYPGLRASFIPLRKVRYERGLSFLTPSELASSALWTAQFLASGVLMRVSGGKKRLYVTQRDAYIQSSNHADNSWTWPELRQLPRYRPDPGPQIEGHDDQCQPIVAEADAKEPCWAFCELFDAPPPSANTSFGSHQSVQLSMRPADRDWRRSMTPSSILKFQQPQPISPLSEFHPQRPTTRHHRTVSASLLDPAPLSASKRRLNGSPVKQSSAPHAVSRAPSTAMIRPKRRRVSSSSPQVDGGIQDAQVTIWADTPRRSREPPSPFFSSEPQLPRTNSDLASRPSQRSAAIARKSTPSAYATPHSGPFIAPGHSRVGDAGADDDSYHDDDGEQSWRGLATGDDDSEGSSSEDGADAGAEDHQASFSGDDSTFSSEDEPDDDLGEEEEQSERQNSDDDDEDDGEDSLGVMDTLLDVLEY